MKALPTGLTLRRTVIAGTVCEDDYDVRWRGRDIGRIHLAIQTVPPQWWWGINLPVPVGHRHYGMTPTFDEAKTAFKAAWEKFLPTLTEADLEYAWKLRDEAEARAQRQRERAGRPR